MGRSAAVCTDLQTDAHYFHFFHVHVCTREDFIRLFSSSAQFEENIAHCCGTRNKQVTTDLNSTSWNVGQISVLSALSCRNKGRRNQQGGKGKKMKQHLFRSTALPHIFVYPVRGIFLWRGVTASVTADSPIHLDPSAEV